MARGRILLIVAVWLISAGGASAQVWTACFQPGTAALTTEGYVAIREAAAYAGDHRESALVIRTARDEGNSPRVAEIRLELAQQGLEFQWMREEVDPEPALADCLRIGVRENAGPGLWHFYGPYFEAGSDVVPASGRQGLRFITAGYRPGERVYCIKGHADPAERNPALGARRAVNVALELVRLGVRWEDIRTRGYGDEQVVRPSPDGEPQPLNRRVYIQERRRCPASFD